MVRPQPVLAMMEAICVQVWRGNEQGELEVEATGGLRVVLAQRPQIEQALADAKYHRIIHVRNAALSALREVRPWLV